MGETHARTWLTGGLVALAALIGAAPAVAAPARCPESAPAQTVARAGSVLENLGFDTAGRLTFVDLLSGTVRTLDAPGTAPRFVATLAAPGGVQALPGGRVAVASGNAIGVLLPGGARIVALDPATGARRTIASGLGGANGLARAADGTLYSSDPLLGVIDRVAPDGRVTRGWWRGAGGPNGLAVSADGSTLYANLSLGARIVAIDVATRATRTVLRFGSDRLLAVPDGLTLAPDGTLYATLYLAGEVWRISPTGAACVLARGLKTPTSAAVVPDGGPFPAGQVFVTASNTVRAMPGVPRAPSAPQ